MTLAVGSLFSGLGAFDLAFDRAGFRVAWQCEIDKHARAVLAHHWPGVPCYGDIAAVDPADLEPVDVVAFGSPCQDLSVAGKRAGMEGARSGLFYEATRIIRGLRPAPAFCLWENVAGALSSANGWDFAAVLDTLAECGALDLCWRLLDGQYAGVAQRRRRVWLVADFGGQRAGPVLLESESLRGHPATGREARERVAATIGAGTHGSGPTDPETAGAYVVNGHAYPSHGDTAGADGARQGKGPNTTLDDGALVVAPTLDHISVRNGQFLGSGGARIAPPEVVACDVADTLSVGANQTTGFVGDVIAHAITASAGHHGHSSPRGDGADNLVIGFSHKDNGRDAAVDVAPTLRAMEGRTSSPAGSGGAAVAVSLRGREGGGTAELGGDASPALRASQGGGDKPHVLAFADVASTLDTECGGHRGQDDSGSRQVATPMTAFNWQSGGDCRINPTEERTDTLHAGQTPAVSGPGMLVRRLTPLECLRLMSLPDDWLDGLGLADSVKYRLIGNSLICNEAFWIASRIRQALEEGRVS